MKQLVLICTFLFSVLAATAQWTPDILGDNYFFRYVYQNNDYSGAVRCTIIKKNTLHNQSKAIFYLHGYNDYFFQKEMGDRFVASGYNFYALDLRKYGRSIMPGQKKFEVRRLDEYFADIDSTLTEIVKDGNKSIIVMGHSTGGLILSYYMGKNAGEKFPITGMILNSPFLDMNLSPFLENYAVPVVSVIAPFVKRLLVSESDGNAYAQSLLRKYHGEWEYNTKWKLEYSPCVFSCWLGAIHRAHVFVQAGTDIKVPILLMYSDKTIHGSQWTPEHCKGDAVLDVDDIAMYGAKLGDNVHQLRVHNGLHDLILSPKPVRNALYKSIFNWIDEKGL